MIDMQRERLNLSWSPTEINLLEDDLRVFLRDVRSGTVPKVCLEESFRCGEALTKSWEPIAKKYKYLSKFCIGLGTIFPGTATVEGDLSI